MKINKTAILLVILLSSITGEAFAAGALPDTGQTTVYATGDDGYYQSGAQPSYTDNGNGTVIDNNTGLIWVKDSNAAGIGGTYVWLDALNGCENLNYAGYSDWRLPNINELWSIVNYSKTPCINTTYFLNTSISFYWSSTTFVTYLPNAWLVYFGDGDVSGAGKTYAYPIRCVRGGP